MFRFQPQPRLIDNSGDPKSDPLKTGHFVGQISNGLSISTQTWFKEQSSTIGNPGLLVSIDFEQDSNHHLKTGPFHNRPLLDHFKTGQVQFSNPHCYDLVHATFDHLYCPIFRCLLYGAILSSFWKVQTGTIEFQHCCLSSKLTFLLNVEKKCQHFFDRIVSIEAVLTYLFNIEQKCQCLIPILSLTSNVEIQYCLSNRSCVSALTPFCCYIRFRVNDLMLSGRRIYG